jgi:IS1 family transposase
VGKVWVHVALATLSRFVIDTQVGPRTLEMAAQLVASVALLPGILSQRLLLLVDNYPPYPQAILRVLGLKRHGRRRGGRGRRKLPDLKAPPGLLVGVVQKLRDAGGNLLGVRTKALFGSGKKARSLLQKLKLGRQINTAHLERCNGTLRTDLARLIRRTHAPSHLVGLLRASLLLWRDLYNWTRVHGSLEGRTPAMALGLTAVPWKVCEYVSYPVHWSDLQEALLAEERQNVLTSALDAPKRRKCLPTS